MKTKTLSLSFLGLTFALLGVACTAQPLPEDGATGGAAGTTAEPTEATHQALINNGGYGATECPEGDACQCQGQDECLTLAHNCRGFWYCNNDPDGSNLRCICWQNAGRVSTVSAVSTSRGAQQFQP
jgi:hypothetical protein